MNNILSDRQIEILELRTSGLENREIATKLEISVSTVKNILSKACKNLGARNVTNAVATFTLYNAVSSGSLEYPQLPLTREAINQYLDTQITDLDIKIFADAICNDISGQGDFRQLEGYEWDEFIVNFITFMTHIQAYKNRVQ